MDDPRPFLGNVTLGWGVPPERLIKVLHHSEHLLHHYEHFNGVAQSTARTRLVGSVLRAAL